MITIIILTYIHSTNYFHQSDFYLCR